MSALSSTLALLLACGSFLVYELLTFRGTLRDALTGDGRVIAVNVTAPILFDDPGAATSSLAALNAKPEIRAAIVLDRTGKPFSTFGEASPDLLESFRKPMSEEEVRFAPNSLRIRIPVLSDNLVVGAIVLESSLDTLGQRIRRYLLLAAGVLILSLLAAVAGASWLQRGILNPILRLTAAAQQVSTRRDYSVRVTPPRGDELGLLTNTFNDMLSQIETQSRDLQQAVRLRDEFLSIASHELKTPLTPLQLQVQTLLRCASDAGGETMVPRVQVLDRQVRRLSKLVDDLLDISRITSRKLELQLEEVDLTALLQDVVERYQTEASRRGCQLRLSAPDRLVGQWDPSRLEQVLVNLISNALKYGAGKPIDITVKEEEGRALIVVEDQGIGVKPEDRERIFRRFERAVSERHYGGFGLGLWIVKEILGSLGGSVFVEDAPSQGARFVVTLPLENGDRLLFQPALASAEK